MLAVQEVATGLGKRRELKRRSSPVAAVTAVDKVGAGVRGAEGVAVEGGADGVAVATAAAAMLTVHHSGTLYGPKGTGRPHYLEACTF